MLLDPVISVAQHDLKLRKVRGQPVHEPLRNIPQREFVLNNDEQLHVDGLNRGRRLFVLSERQFFRALRCLHHGFDQGNA